jgi:hypothetical protein
MSFDARFFLAIVFIWHVSGARLVTYYDSFTQLLF